jgi:hypothetical protein
LPRKNSEISFGILRKSLLDTNYPGHRRPRGGPVVAHESDGRQTALMVQVGDVVAVRPRAKFHCILASRDTVLLHPHRFSPGKTNPPKDRFIIPSIYPLPQLRPRESQHFTSAGFGYTPETIRGTTLTDPGEENVLIEIAR